MTPPNDGVKFLLIFLYAAWVLAFGYSFVAFMTTAPDDMGFTRGLNRVNVFLGWHGMAGILALAIFAISLQWPKGAAPRRIGKVPLVIAGLLVLGIAGVILWAANSG